MDIRWAGLGDVVLVGLIAGVGLVALFGFGIRLLGMAAETRANAMEEAMKPASIRPGARQTATAATGGDGRAEGQARLLQALAYLCFVVCAGVAIYGITLLLRK